MKNAKAALWLLFSQFVFVVATALWALFTLMSLLMMDQFDDLTAVQAASLFMLWCFPIAVIGASIAAWLLYHNRKFRHAVWIGLLPLLWIAPFFGFFEF